MTKRKKVRLCAPGLTAYSGRFFFPFLKFEFFPSLVTRCCCCGRCCLSTSNQLDPAVKRPTLLRADKWLFPLLLGSCSAAIFSTRACSTLGNSTFEIRHSALSSPELSLGRSHSLEHYNLLALHEFIGLHSARSHRRHLLQRHRFAQSALAGLHPAR